MPEANFTDLDKMMIFTAYKNGLKVGESISKAIESGGLIVPDNETLEVILNSFYTYEYPMYQKVLAKIGSPEFSTAGNIGLAAGGLCLAGISTQNYFETKNPVAKVCYAASIVCSSTAMLTLILNCSFFNLWTTLVKRGIILKQHQRLAWCNMALSRCHFVVNLSSMCSLVKVCNFIFRSSFLIQYNII
jgi:hypothetical protein